MRKRIDSLTDNRSPFARRLQFALKHDKISGSKLACKIGINPATLSAYITGRAYPSFEVLMKIQKELDISLDWLCGLVD